MNDLEAWQELADIYLEGSDYVHAAYCYEQIIILSQNPYHMITLAEIYHTINNLVAAKNYYCCVLAKHPDLNRALWGLYKTLQKSKDKQMLPLVQECLAKRYGGVFPL